MKLRNLFKRKIHLKTTYGDAKYIREALLSLGTEYEVSATPDRIAYTAYLTNREFTYLNDYLDALASVDVYPVLLNP